MSRECPAGHGSPRCTAGAVNSLRVLVVDRSPLIREALRAVLEAGPDVQVVASTDDCAEAIRLAAECEPAVAIIDAQLQEVDLRAARTFHLSRPEIGIVAFSGFDRRPTEVQLRQMGIAEYLVKGAHIGRVVDAVRQAAQHLIR